jgi:hypothetical protein
MDGQFSRRENIRKSQKKTFRKQKLSFPESFCFNEGPLTQIHIYVQRERERERKRERYSDRFSLLFHSPSFELSKLGNNAIPEKNVQFRDCTPGLPDGLFSNQKSQFG